MNAEKISPKKIEPSLYETLRTMKPRQLGTLSFNISAFAWIGLNTSLHGVTPYTLPCSYLQPNLLNTVSGGVFIYGIVLACWSIKRGSFFPAVVTLTFVWSIVCTVIRECSG